jgi:hypothetical protein
MRISTTTIAVASAILFSCSLFPAASAQEGPMVITPQPQGDSPYGGGANSYGQNAAPQGTYPHGNAGPDESYQPALGFASEKLPEGGQGTFSMKEIKNKGHRFFGKVSVRFAKVVEYAFQRSGRPNGYILGEEAGGAFVAGLRYGEGVLYTKDAGEHRVYWQGPSIGYDFGADGSKVMVLVYNLHSPDQVYNTFGGVDGSAYFIGGVGITYLAHNDLVLAPISSGVGLRLGANLGFLKYTRQPTWNPF